MPSGMIGVCNRLKPENGASAVEFALVAPIFFALIFGIMIYGYYFLTLGLVHHIAYEAARASVSGLTDDERSSLAHARASQLISELGAVLDTTAITVVAAPAQTGVYGVTVHYTFSVAKF